MVSAFSTNYLYFPNLVNASPATLWTWFQGLCRFSYCSTYRLPFKHSAIEYFRKRETTIKFSTSNFIIKSIWCALYWEFFSKTANTMLEVNFHAINKNNHSREEQWEDEWKFTAMCTLTSVTTNCHHNATGERRTKGWLQYWRRAPRGTTVDLYYKQVFYIIYSKMDSQGLSPSSSTANKELCLEEIEH